MKHTFFRIRWCYGNFELRMLKLFDNWRNTPSQLPPPTSGRREECK